jgi:ketosteroid isomerase-like protein
MGNKELVAVLLDAMGADDSHRLEEVLASDVRWWGPPSAVAAGMPSPVEGRDTVIAMIATPYDFFAPRSRVWSVHHLIGEADFVAVHANLRATTAGGTPYSNEYHLLVRVDRDRIADVWEHVDTAEFHTS